MATAPKNQGTRKKKREGGFGQKLKGVGERIVQEVKKVPGTVYREAIKPEAKRILEKFTEEGPPPPERIGEIPHAPVPGATPGLRRGRHRLPPEIPAEVRGQVSLPAPRAQTVEEMVRERPAHYRAQGRTRAYGIGSPVLPRAPGESQADYQKRVARRQRTLEQRKTPAQRAREPGEKPALERPAGETRARPPRAVQETPPSVVVTQAGPLTDQTRPTVEARQAAPGTPTFRTTVTERTTPVIQAMPGRAEQRRRREQRERLRKRRKWSARKTYKEIGKAAGAAAEPIEVDRIDTTAQELARAMTEEDIAREQARVEAVLREGRRPRRERPRYRYRVRGMGRNDNRGR